MSVAATVTAADFILTETSSIAHATIPGLIPSRTPLENIWNVEIELYHVFPKDSNVERSQAPVLLAARCVRHLRGRHLLRWYVQRRCSLGRER